MRKSAWRLSIAARTSMVLDTDAGSEEQFISQLQSLKGLRKQTQALFELKSQIIATNETLDTKKNLLEEMTTERRRLVKEKKMMMEMIQAIQRDIDTVTEGENSLQVECNNLEQSLQRLREVEYEPLQDRLPNLQQEIDAQLAKALEERRNTWQESEKTNGQPSDRSTNEDTSSRRRPAGSGRRRGNR
ncbi:hypothetical protein NQZ79_g2538 [Umbelopsis isabellina]|nr:hypothetical protein NQZ79_g2538 [Umbelopsis isabellina]